MLKVLQLATTAARDSMTVKGVIEFRTGSLPMYVLLARDHSTYLVSLEDAEAPSLHMIPLSEGESIKATVRREVER